MKDADKEIILVDENDNPVGVSTKMLVHEQGLLHRAFSVFIFNTKGELLLQQRADNKYHSAGLWSNTCCSHPSPGEDTANAAAKRLFDEMGIETNLHHINFFTYKSEFENGLIEHELDHIYFGMTDKLPEINSHEVKNYKYVSMDDLNNDLQLHPEKYSTWLRICFPEVINHHNKFINYENLK